MLSMAVGLIFNYSRIDAYVKKNVIIYLFYSVFIALLALAFYNSTLVFESCLQLAICGVAFMLGYSLRFMSDKQIFSSKIIFCSFALIMGLVSVFESGGFVIQDTYAISLKNSSGAILGTAMIIAIAISLETKRKFTKVLSVIVFMLLLISLLTFRNRSTLIGCVIALVLLLWKSSKDISYAKLFYYTFVTCILGFIAMYLFEINFMQYAYDSLFANKDTSDVNDLSSGRLDMIKYGWENVITVNPIGGNMAVKKEMGCIDCFPVSVLNFQGLFGVLVYLPLYVFLFHSCYKRCKYINYCYLYPYLCLFVLLVTSFFEASFPFSPGTAVFATYFFLGIEEGRLNIRCRRQLVNNRFMCK